MLTAELIIEVIKEIKLCSKPGELKYNLSLNDQGIDSLDRSTLYLSLEEKYGIKLPEKDEDKFDSIDSLISYANKQ